MSVVRGGESKCMATTLITRDHAGIRVELSKCSSKEFPQEFVIVCSSNFGALRICHSRFGVSGHKVLYSLFDGLCEGNPVKIDMQLMVERDAYGVFRFGAPKLDPSGTFSERRLLPKRNHLVYGDKFGERKHEFLLRRYYHLEEDYKKRERWIITHSLCYQGNSNISYGMEVRCDSAKGLQVQLLDPYCTKDSTEGKAGNSDINCAVSGKPPNGKQENSLGLRPPLPSAQAITIYNTGLNLGYFNGATLINCTFIQAENLYVVPADVDFFKRNSF